MLRRVAGGVVPEVSADRSAFFKALFFLFYPHVEFTTIFRNVGNYSLKNTA
jgi:hypothetical protein